MSRQSMYGINLQTWWVNVGNYRVFHSLPVMIPYVHCVGWSFWAAAKMEAWPQHVSPTCDEASWVAEDAGVWAFAHQEPQAGTRDIWAIYIYIYFIIPHVFCTFDSSVLELFFGYCILIFCWCMFVANFPVSTKFILANKLGRVVFPLFRRDRHFWGQKEEGQGDQVTWPHVSG